MRLGARVHGLRVADRAKLGLAVGKGVGKLGVIGEVVCLEAIRLHVEQLRRQPRVADVLVAGSPQHERGGGRKGGVKLAEADSLAVVLLRQPEDRLARQVGILGRELGADRLDDAGETVHQVDVGVGDLALGNLGACHDQRNPDRRLQHRRFPPHAVLAKLLAVVRRIDDAGAPGLAGLLQGGQDLPDVVIEEGDHPVVRRDRLADRRLVHRLVRPCFARCQTWYGCWDHSAGRQWNGIGSESGGYRS